MKCPVCQTEGKTSNVFVGLSTTTLAYCQPYFDKNGKYHHNDNNKKTTSYSCSNGHNFTDSDLKKNNNFGTVVTWWNSLFKS